MKKLLDILKEILEDSDALKQDLSQRFPDLKFDVTEAMDVPTAMSNMPAGPGWYIWYAKTNKLNLKKNVRDELSDELNFGDDPHVEGKGLELYIGLASDFKKRFLRNYSGYFTDTTYVSSRDSANKESYGSDKLQTMIPYLVTYEPNYLTFLGKSFNEWLSSNNKIDDYNFETSELSAGAIIKDLNEFFMSLGKQGTMELRKEVGGLVSRRIKQWYENNIKVRFITVDPSQHKYFKSKSNNLRKVEGFLTRKLVNMDFKNDSSEPRITFNKGKVDPSDGDLDLKQ